MAPSKHGYDVIGVDEKFADPMRPAAMEVEVPKAAPRAAAMSSKQATGLAAGVALLFFGLASNGAPKPAMEQSGSSQGSSSVKSHGKFDSKGRAVLASYDTSRTFASFLPALGGEYGTPLWAFFVNRGQAITSYGSGNKDTSMMEFNAANKAYEYVSSDGFRTFVKGTRSGVGLMGGHGTSFAKEPFGGQPSDAAGSVRDMFVGMNEVEIKETDTAHGLDTSVLYFTLPGEKFGALVRRTTFSNTGKGTLQLEVLDGQAKVQPAGCNDWNLKNMGRTLEAWMNVYFMSTSKNTEPYFKLSMSLADTAEVSEIVEGHWAIAFVEAASDDEGRDDDDEGPQTRPKKAKNAPFAKLPFVVDPVVVFGPDKSFAYPSNFALASGSAGSLAMGPQVTTSKTPCAFAAASLSIPQGASVTVTSVYGRTPSREQYEVSIKDALNARGYITAKHAEAVALAERLTEKVAMKSGVPIFDAYVKQQFLDNLLRGGFPVVLGDAASDPKIFHTFSRIHGDVERDYNYFQIDACYFSMGPGNFRDVNQNRRCDVFQQPKVGAFDVGMFLSFIQADGYNPLTVNSAIFILPDAEVRPEDAGSLNSTIAAKAAKAASATAKRIAAASVKDDHQQRILASLLSNNAGWRPGDLFIALAVNHITLDVSDAEFIELATSAAILQPSAVFPQSQNGFWADHWTYHLDLVLAFLAVFPDREADLLYGQAASSRFYMSPVACTTRATKYVFVPGKGPRQYNFITQDQEKINAMIASSLVVPTDYSWQRAAPTPTSALGPVFTVPAITKLLMLGVTRFALLDPFGMGLEYEGGKPGWNDAMNGLCGLFGSGMPEAYEALRIFQFLKAKAAAHASTDVAVPEEMDTLMRFAAKALAQGSKLSDFEYWDAVRTSLEEYREATRVTFSGKMVAWSSKALLPFFDAVIAKFKAGSARAIELNGGLTPTYWIFTVTSFDRLGSKDPLGREYVRPRAFEPKSVPLFLEGPVRQMKTLSAKKELLAVYELVKASPLRDKALGMYKISESLDSMSFEVGRMKAFAPGWLENESVWLHMSYKFYLEMLRGGLYDQFFEELKTGLVPFMDPKVYGRSPLECSSFIASSAHPDKSIHGQGFLARLSGSTAEFLSMWNLMMMGPTPFRTSAKNGLEMDLAPILPGSWFDSAGEVTFTLLGSVPVTYVNPTGLNTWDVKLAKASAVVTTQDGSRVPVEGGVLPELYARMAREGSLSAITITFKAV